MTNNVHHPKHYTKGKIEVIDYIYDKLTKEQFIGYCMGNVLKYTSRYDKKGGIEDLEKADVYLRWARDRMHDRPLTKRVHKPQIDARV